jgi:hypothetical protein
MWLPLRRRRAVWLLLIALCVIGPRKSAIEGAPKPNLTASDSRVAALTSLPLYFIENRGQVNDRVGLYLQGRNKSVYFTPQGLTFVLTHAGTRSDRKETHGRRIAESPSAVDDAAYALRLDFLGANPAVHPRGQAPTEAIVSYLKGDRSQWKTGLPTYGEVVYKDLWPGIDLVYTGTESRLKYTFFVQPGADPSQIKLSYRGATSAAVNARGELEVSTPGGGFHDAAPISYQEIDGKQIDVATRYALTKNRANAADAGDTFAYGFDLAAYDRRHVLVIDPTIFIYAGYIGGESDDQGYDIAVGPSGGAYVAGATSSDEFSFPDGGGIGALPGYDDTFNGGQYGDAYVAKVRADGTGLVYVSYLGGSGDDFAFGIAVNNNGNAFVVGKTDSFDFPTEVGPSLNQPGDYDAFVVKMNTSGTALDYSGFIGGDDADSGESVAVDSEGAAYVTGWTASTQTTFPVGPAVGSPDMTYNGGFADAFVAKVKPDGTGLVYAGYIGGNDEDFGLGIAVDGLGAAYVGGFTRSTEQTFPVMVGPDLSYNGGPADAFVAKVRPDGTGLEYAGYIGGERNDEGHDIAVDATGATYITGETNSTEMMGFPAVVGPDLSYNGGFSDAFVAKVDTDGTALIYAGYIGGAKEDSATSIAVNGNGQAYAAGWTESRQATFPDGDGFGNVPGPDRTFNGVRDAFAVKVNAGGTALIYATYIGGHEYEVGYGIAVDGDGYAYIVGHTQSPEVTFPNGNGFGNLPGPDQTFNFGTYDAFVVKIGPQ